VLQATEAFYSCTLLSHVLLSTAHEQGEKEVAAHEQWENEVTAHEQEENDVTAHEQIKSE
jgi:hypothetical protein